MPVAATPPTLLSGPDKGTPVSITPAFRKSPEHRVCYQAKLAKKFIAQTGCGPTTPGDRGSTLPKLTDIHTTDPFGDLEHDSIKPFELCIPSLKIPPQ